jgi:adenylosuccinate synthase
VSDATNVPNPHQGSLRFGWLDLPALGAVVRADLSDARGSGVAVRHRVAVTCLDQVGPAARLADGATVPPADLPALAALACGADGALGSWGPTRDDVLRSGRTRLAA